MIIFNSTGSTPWMCFGLMIFLIICALAGVRRCCLWLKSFFWNRAYERLAKSELEVKSTARQTPVQTTPTKLPWLPPCNCHSPILEDILRRGSIEKLFDQYKDEHRGLCTESKVCRVFFGGAIYPFVEGSCKRVEAIAFKESKVIAYGSYGHVLEMAKNSGQLVEETRLREGQCLMPGFVDPHVHIVLSALQREVLDFGPFEREYLREDYSRIWVQEKVQDALHKRKQGHWILGNMLDPSLMSFEKRSEGARLNKLGRFETSFFDDISRDVPILIISASGHTAYVNSAALRAVYKNTQELRSKYSSFEEFKSDTNRSGGLQEAALISYAIATVPKLQIMEILFKLKKNLDKHFEEMFAHGITTIYDAAMTTGAKRALQLYKKISNSTPRIGFALICSSPEEVEKLPRFSAISASTFKSGLYQGHVKLISDGSNQGLTGFQEEPYRCEPANNYGIFNFCDSDSNPRSLTQTYLKMFITVINKGYSMMVHANGNKAVAFTISAFETAIKNDPLSASKRHRIEHCSLLNQEKIDQMRRIGVSPSFLIGHVGYWGYSFRNAIFEEKAEELDLCRSALLRDMRISLHSDNNVTPLGPLRKMEQSITRIMEQDPRKGILNPSERLSFQQALRACTIDAAWQIFADDYVGDLSIGKLADFVILEKDPFNLEDYVGLRDIRVDETWLNGNQVFKRTYND